MGRKLDTSGAGENFGSGEAMRHTGVLVLIVVVLTSASSVDAATTSRLEGLVVDDQDQPLAGVQITISSQSLIGGPQSRSPTRAAASPSTSCSSVSTR